MDLQKLTCLIFFISCLDIGLSQKDCTGIKCPLLQNCIEEVLERRACCATCVQTGCTCEGYQYYDCVHAGFRNGKVPEGKSYFVDSGSTECSCPLGGGKIGCRFIPCPEIPSNCIAVAQPVDECTQCARIGCIHGNEKYEAGHSFHMEPCRVCHCPKDGGSLMCSPIPDCDPQRPKKPVPPSSTGSGDSRRVSSNRDNRQTSPAGPFYKVALGKSLPLYKQDTPSSGTDREGYAFTQTDPTPQEMIHTVESTVGSLGDPESSSAPSVVARGGGQELREKRTGTYEEKRDEAHYLLHSTESTYNRAEGQTSIVSITTMATTQKPMAHTPRQRQDIDKGFRRDSDRGIKNFTTHSGRFDTEVRQGDILPGHAEGHLSSHQGHGRSEKSPVEQRKRQTQRKPEHGTFPMVQFSPTSRAPVRVRGEGEQPRRQSLTLGMVQNTARGSEVSAKELVDVCCEAGEKWASANGHCNNMALPREDRHSICWTAQKQCCLGSLRDSRCFAGMNVARDGGVCEENASDRCGADSYQECCSCCSLGLRLRSEGHRCEAHQYLGYPCSHIFLTCCQGENEGEGKADEQREGGDGWHAVRERPSLDPAAPPTRVSDGPFPKEAFSVGERDEQDMANAAEGPPPQVEDVDECQVYPGDLCHHRCVNTPGSYKCDCHPGYALQADAFTCAPEPLDEENRLKEEEGVASEAVVHPTLPPTALPAVRLDPCQGNGPCMQQCRPQAGRPHCSCFHGFALMADGYSCEDINECQSPGACQQGERCVNTAGSYACQRSVTCPRGYQVNNEVCEDVDECAHMSHNCGLGFQCVNTEGSYRCSPRLRCSAGFTADAQGNCMDIDECAGVGQLCSPGYNCLNTVGSYSCQRKVIICGRGYHASPDESRCIDVDECQASLHRCGEGQLCHNLPGSYRCDCQTGYQYDMFRKTCVDINECWRYPGRLCAQTCENSPGSYQCSCTAGFRLTADGKNCEDVNECLTNPCSQECANVYGSYQCYCRQGYHLSGDGLSCEDIDECTQSMGHLCTYKCVNVPGSYQCACPEYGYTMSPNGHSCRDIDECAVGAYNCSLAETCYNIQGGYRCLSFHCPPNYRKVSDTRCERISCPNHLDCQNSPLRITYYYLSFQSNIVIPAQVFRIGPSPAYSGDNVIVTITHGNEENYFSTRKLNAYTGAVYLHRQVREPQDFLVEVEMKLWRQGTFTTFQAKIYVFITANSL